MERKTITELSDAELLTETRRLADTERRTTAALVSLLAEVDARRLYLGEGYSSLFAFCTRALRLSEPAAYARITAARTARRFPVILPLLTDGAISVTTVGLLAPHLSDENCDAILEAARHKSKRDVERLVAAMHPQPDIASSVRALPVPMSRVSPESPESHELPALLVDDAPVSPTAASKLVTSEEVSVSPNRGVVAPIAPRRYLVRITVSEDTHRKLERARALLRHQIPDGDPAAIVDRALTVLLEQAERTKFAATERPATKRAQPASVEENAHSRRIPAAVRRAVWVRDDGRCVFVGSESRCAETGFLEFHHVVPFAAGGPSTTDNLQLRCRAHNAYEAARSFGDWRLRAATSRERNASLTSRGVWPRHTNAPAAGFKAAELTCAIRRPACRASDQ